MDDGKSCTRRSWDAPSAWPVQRRRQGEKKSAVNESVHAAACRATAPLALPSELLRPLEQVPLAHCLQRRRGLPRLGAALQEGVPTESESRTPSKTTGVQPLRVCYLGGSVTEQKAGWRPRVTSWLQSRLSTNGRRRAVSEIPAFCGNAGSKLLSFMVRDWVVAHRPDLVFIELAINDGDTLLETDDEESVGAALEGIVRELRRVLPACELCLLTMFLRDDLPLQRRTGSKAWSDNEDSAAADTYHIRAPAVHSRVAGRYGVPSINLVPLMATLSSQARDLVFRDDCHHHNLGAEITAAVICAALDRLASAESAQEAVATRVVERSLATSLSAPKPLSLPEPLHPSVWPPGRAERVTPQQLSFFYLPPSEARGADMKSVQRRLLERHTQLDLDPLQPTQRAAWWLLYPGDYAEVQFDGSRLGVLTLVGPDAAIVSYSVDGGAWTGRVCLLDHWAYYWRLAVVMLVQGLPAGRHVARVRVEAQRPDAAVLKKPPSGEHWDRCQQEGRDHKLWLMHWLVSDA